MKSGRWRNELCIHNSILIQLLMEGKENKERIKREFVCGIKIGVVLSNSFIHSSYLLLLL